MSLLDSWRRELVRQQKKRDEAESHVGSITAAVGAEGQPGVTGHDIAVFLRAAADACERVDASVP